MIYSYPSCSLADPRATRLLLLRFLRQKYWGLFSFQPNTITCIDEQDIKTLEKYEPFGLVLYKDADIIVIPTYILDDYYDIYKNIVDLVRPKLKRNYISKKELLMILNT